MRLTRSLVRALGYVAAYYGNQLRKGGSWKKLQKVIGLNIFYPFK
jgi:hypothetical protein